MRSLGTGQDHEMLADALDEQADLFEQDVTFYRFVSRDAGRDPATGRMGENVFVEEEASAVIATPTTKDLQLVGGIYQQGDVMVQTRFEVRPPDHADGSGGDELGFWNGRWRFVGPSHRVGWGGDTAYYRTLARRIG